MEGHFLKFGNVEEIYDIIDELRRDLDIFTNIYLSKDEINKFLNQEKACYEYIKGKYLNIYIEYENHIKLYYAIGNCDDYKVNVVNDKKITTNFIYTESNSHISKRIEEIFGKLGFAEHAVWEKYKLNCKKEKIDNLYDNFSLKEQNIVVEKCEIGKKHHSMLKEIFSDYSYDIEELSFYKDRLCYEALKDNQLIATIILEENGNNMTIEYIYVDKKYRGCGIGDILFKHIIGIYNTHIFNSWIDIKNIKSIQLNEKYKFTKQSIYNKILIK